VDAGGATERALSSGARPAAAPAAQAGDGGGGADLLGQLQEGASGLLDDAKTLGGQVTAGAGELLDDAKQLGGDALDGANGLAGGLADLGSKAMKGVEGALEGAGGALPADIRGALGAASGSTWNPPFDLEPADNTADATVRLVDMQSKLKEWNDVGYASEMSVANGAIERQLKAFYGPSRNLTAADVTTLTNLGLIAQQAYKGALANLAAMISAQLDKYTGAEAQAALDNANELLHQEFMKGDGSNKVADLKEAITKAKDFAGKVKDYVDYAKEAKSVIKAAEKLEGVSNALSTFTAKLSTAKDALGLAGEVATLAGKVAQKPGDTANTINRIRSGLNIADFIISKSSVPIIGQWWSGYIKPCAELALDKLQRLGDMIDKSTRSNVADEWWQRASRGMSAPNITESGLHGTLLQSVFPGGQPVLDFLWSLFRGNPPDSVPAAVQKHMLKFRKQFNAGQPESDQLQTDSAWSNAWNLFGDEKSPNLRVWMLKNKETVWAMQYGSLPHP
jgi:hypothetical protein